MKCGYICNYKGIIFIDNEVIVVCYLYTIKFFNKVKFTDCVGGRTSCPYTKFIKWRKN